MAILIDTRIQRFVEGCLLGENEETISNDVIRGKIISFTEEIVK